MWISILLHCLHISMGVLSSLSAALRSNNSASNFICFFVGGICKSLVYGLYLTELGFPSNSTLSNIHFRFCLHSFPHLFDRHFGHGKWQPGQESSMQSHTSFPQLIRMPFSSYTLFLLRPENQRKNLGFNAACSSSIPCLSCLTS